MHVTIQNIKTHSGVIIYLRTVKIKRENGGGIKYLICKRYVDLYGGKTAEEFRGKWRGETFLLMLISLSGWLLLTLSTVLV